MNPCVPGQPPLPLLLLEDDPAIAETVRFALAREGLDLVHVALLAEARERLATQAHAAALLDVGLPDGSGMDLLRWIRGEGGRSRPGLATLPVLMLTARAEEFDRVLGLELGADDYLGKPFSPRELAARVKALLRRSQIVAQAARGPHEPQDTQRAGDTSVPPGLVLDDRAQRVLWRGQPLPLTRMELRLLQALWQHPGRIWPRDALLDAVWGQQADSTDRTVDTHVKTLRAKLREAGLDEQLVQTHRGLGYALDPAKLKACQAARLAPTLGGLA